MVPSYAPCTDWVRHHQNIKQACSTQSHPNPENYSLVVNFHYPPLNNNCIQPEDILSGQAIHGLQQRS